MGQLMVRCPGAGRPISTGRDVVPEAFRCAAVFFSRTYCPYCRITHEWFAKDAWVRDAEPIEMNSEMSVGRLGFRENETH